VIETGEKSVIVTKHKEKKAQEEYEAALAAWQDEHDQLASVVALARGAHIGDVTIILKNGERAFATVTNVGLVELRKGAGHFEGHSAGVSVPIGQVHGRSVRYRVGATRGHFVQGTPAPQAVDTGTLTITNQRVVFVGAAKAIECLYPKLVSIQRLPGQVSVAVSNRQKPTVLHYGSQIEDWVAMRLDLALAVYNGQADDFAEMVGQQVAELEKQKPRPPASLSSA
jgi:hypothetical protein